jgi:hypothetical protein
MGLILVARPAGSHAAAMVIDRHHREELRPRHIRLGLLEHADNPLRKKWFFFISQNPALEERRGYGRRLLLAVA